MHDVVGVGVVDFEVVGFRDDIAVFVIGEAAEISLGVGYLGNTVKNVIFIRICAAVCLCDFAQNTVGEIIICCDITLGISDLCDILRGMLFIIKNTLTNHIY